MPKLLLAWELGSGLGHIGPLRAIGGELVRRGHGVAIATLPANVELCRQAVVGTGVGLFSLPGLPPASERVRLPGSNLLQRRRPAAGETSLTRGGPRILS